MPTVAAAHGHSPSQASFLLASSGRGDLHLLELHANEATALSRAPVAFPLRPTPPLHGARPFQLLAAMHTGPGRFTAVVWTVSTREDGKPARCEVHAVSLARGESGQGPLPLHVDGVQLLRRSPLPPHAALCNPATHSILIAIDPDQDEDEDDGAASGAVPSSTGGTTSNPPPVEEDGVEAVSPRTLEAAVQRLAHLTSEDMDEAEELPRNQYADVFKETGPDGVGALGAEPACDLLTFCVDAEQRSSSGPQFRCVDRLVCQPHRLLGCQHDVHDVLRLGLTDDVDCAVVEVLASCDASTPDSASSGGTAEIQHMAGGFLVRHVASVPALAYVAAGKMQRKYLLLGGARAAAAAVLVEAQQYCYVYRRTEGNVPKGEQQVVDLRLSGREGVLGAALLPRAESESGTIEGAAEEGSCLVVLADSSLQFYQLE